LLASVEVVNATAQRTLAVAALAVAACALLRCASFGEDGVTPTPSDGGGGGGGDAGGDAALAEGGDAGDAGEGGAGCDLSVVDAFERTTVAGGPWDAVKETGTGKLSIDLTAPHTGMGSLLIDLPTDATGGAYLSKAFATSSRVSLTYALNVPVAPGRAIVVSSLELTTLSLALFVLVASDGTIALMEQATSEVGRPTKATPLPRSNGGWHTYAIDVTLTAPPHASVTVDGAEGIVAPLTFPFAPAPFEVRAGVGYTENGPVPLRVRIDDVAVCVHR
jgi:hypothetical protein